MVAARPPAVSDLVVDGASGLHFEMGDPAGLAAACRWLAADPALCEQMGREARAHYEAELTPQRSTGRLEAIYREARCSA